MNPAVILIVEDNPITRKMVRLTLESAGHVPLEAGTGQEAQELLASQPVDLVLMDLQLPDMDGNELLRRMRALPRGADIPILACSGFEASIKQARGLRQGFTDILFKPVEPSRLLQATQAYLPLRPLVEGKPGRARAVLVVDDDPVQLKLLKVTLTQLGFQVVTATNGTEALQRIRQQPPDAVVSDVLMPDLDGYHLCQVLRSDPTLAEVPVILVSHYFTEEEDQHLARDVGASALVVRGPDSQATIKAILAGLDRPPGVANPQANRQDRQYQQRLIRQLECQATINTDFANRVAILEAELAILAGFVEALKDGPGIEKALPDLVQRCLDTAGVSQGAAYLVAPDGSVYLSARVGYLLTDNDPLGDLFGHTELLRQAIEQRAPVQIPSPVLAEEATRDLLNRARASALVLIPICSGDECLGVLLLAATRQDFSTSWLNFARAIGGQIGQALALARAMSQLYDSEARWRGVVETAVDAIILIDERGNIEFFNPAAHQLFGYSAAEVRGQSIKLLMPDPYHSELNRYLQRYRTTGDHRIIGVSHEVLARSKDGRMFPVELSISEVGLRDRRVFTGILRDVSERKQAEEARARLEQQLLQSQKMEAIGRLAGGVAHDFNNLLTVIAGYADLLRSGLHPSDPMAAFVGEIIKAGERAADLTKQLLAFSRKQIISPVILNLNDVLAGLEKMLHRLIGEDIDLAYVLDPELGQIKADPGQVEQVLLNLVVNARDAMPRGGKLTIETANVDLDAVALQGAEGMKSGAGVRLVVSDTGCGIDRATLPQIFEPFFTTKEAGRGTGLGLATVYGIVKQSDGHIIVYSEPGVGTTFNIYLPRLAAPATPPKSQLQEETVLHGTETVMVVEDGDALRALMTQVLERHGYTVLSARHGGEALLLCERHTGRIDLLVTDVVMPQLSGLELAQRLAPLRPNLKVLYVSGYTDEAVVRHGVLSANMHFLQKPFTPTNLARKVRDVLQRKND